jgi:hypothetical protein
LPGAVAQRQWNIPRPPIDPFQGSVVVGVEGAAVNLREIRLVSAIVASGVIGISAVAVAITQASYSAAGGSTMQTGVTQTATTAPTEPATAKAVPIMTGPAPLPKEEQGLPG